MSKPKPPNISEQISQDPLKALVAAALLWGGYQLFTYRVEQLEKSVTTLTANTNANNLEIGNIKALLSGIDKKIDALAADKPRRP